MKQDAIDKTTIGTEAERAENGNKCQQPEENGAATTRAQATEKEAKEPISDPVATESQMADSHRVNPSGQPSNLDNGSSGQNGEAPKPDRSRRKKESGQPHVATPEPEIATRGQQADVFYLATERDKRAATRGQPHVAKGKIYVEAVGASVGTIAFRLRWRENGKRQPPVYVSRVSIEVYEMIKGGDYEAFKQQLVSSHNAGSVRASHTA